MHRGRREHCFKYVSRCTIEFAAQLRAAHLAYPSVSEVLPLHAVFCPPPPHDRPAGVRVARLYSMGAPLLVASFAETHADAEFRVSARCRVSVPWGGTALRCSAHSARRIPVYCFSSMYDICIITRNTGVFGTVHRTLRSSGLLCTALALTLVFLLRYDILTYHGPMVIYLHIYSHPPPRV
ncbi:hypothetical protein HYPSUDRAFT_365422 [Hypholoma sublateritium FD-334 SS-4]|uniref:Uncharacterized protein n=1 Tax=Hypholoma sublateritium (strain FD-334 SS-4) TaxID=945553 RepID=A0A0D2NFT7_HYPSF|nr:hypothetical protein HYPSUDRAFT_365422 [Hypholoma sublateritium FD-334 SS-4]